MDKIERFSKEYLNIVQNISNSIIVRNYISAKKQLSGMTATSEVAKSSQSQTETSQVLTDLAQKFKV